MTSPDMLDAKNWPATKTVLEPVENLMPYARNTRVHSDEQIEAVANSMKEFGWTVPVLRREDGTIIAGHCRIMAAKKLDITEAPVMVAAGWTEEQCRAYTIADNRLSEVSDWDEDLLMLELGELTDAGYAVNSLGFSQSDLAEMFVGINGVGDPEEAPEADECSTTEVGDVWLMGGHKLICGDATDPNVVDNLLGDTVPHLMVTDPPYGVEYDADWRNHALRSDGSPSNGRAIGAVKNDDIADWRSAWELFPGDVAYVWHAGQRAKEVQESLEVCGFAVRSQIIWVKNQLVIGRGDYHPKHEPCLYVVREGKAGHWVGGRKQTTVWEIDKPRKSETGHSTQKPIECMRRPIENNSGVGDAIYDPFLGSGTTLIAAEMEGRICLGVELNPAYADIIVKRWQDFTGRGAVLEASGVAFDDVAKDRLGRAA